MTRDTYEGLRQAYDRALTGGRPNDTFRSYDLDLGVVVERWVLDVLLADGNPVMTDLSSVVGSDPEAEEVLLAAVATMMTLALATGIEYGRSLPRDRRTHKRVHDLGDGLRDDRRIT